MERRAAVELRAASGRRLEGLAAPFNREARIGAFTEVIRPGAFAATLAGGADVLALVDHDSGRLLGRTASGTLRLRETTRGLEFDLDLPKTSLGEDILALAERGDLGGASIGFRADKEAWPSRDRRELRAVTLLEISVVHAWPAYSETELSVRARPTDDDVRRRLRLRLVAL